MFKVGEQVRNKFSDTVGTVLRVDPPGMRGFVLVEFIPGSDGLCVPKSQLEKISPEGRES